MPPESATVSNPTSALPTGAASTRAPVNAASHAPASLAAPPSRAPSSRWLKQGPYTTPFTYTDRATKSRYIAEKYAPLLATGRRVLDVGCDQKQLQRMVASPDLYVGIDLNPSADRIIDLDHELLPFADQSFDTVLCCDVLEHLARCHEVFDELCRVSRDRVVLSLPNAVQGVLASLLEGQGGRLKHYGLQLDPPRDRHRWFFGFEEAAEFLTRRVERNKFHVEQLDAGSVSSTYWRVGKDAHDVLDHPNAKLGTCWCVIRRS